MLLDPAEDLEAQIKTSNDEIVSRVRVGESGYLMLTESTTFLTGRL
jgi:hypothetical protein